MSLSDRLDAGPPRVVHGTPCSIATALSALPKAEAVALQRMLDDPGWSQRAIRDALADEDIDVGEQTVGRHRRHGCRCFR